MTRHDRVIAEVAEYIRTECSEFNSEILEKLRSDAPRTTPSNVEVRLGNAYYMIGEANYTDYLRAAIYSYLQFHGSELNAPEDRQLHSRVTKDGNLDWSKSLGSAAGTSMPGENFIWVAFLPDSFQNRLASETANKVSKMDSGLDPEIFSSFVNDLSRRGKLGRKNTQEYMGTVAHELTHLLMNQETAVGQLFHEHDINDVDLEQDIAHILGEAEGLSETDQARTVGNNKYISAIDEAFAFFIQDKILGSLNMSKASRFSSYDHPEGISWGYNILLERFGSNVSIDELRNLQFKVFEEVAQRGQVRKGSGYRNPLVYLLKHALPEEDRELINRMREVCEGDLAQAFTDLRRAVSDAENRTGSEQVFKEFKRFEAEIDWDNPREIEDIVLHQILETGAGELSLQEVRNSLRRNIYRELQMLQKMIQNLKQIEASVNDQEIDREIKNALRELIGVEKEIEKLVS